MQEAHTVCGARIEPRRALMIAPGAQLVVFRGTELLTSTQYNYWLGTPLCGKVNIPLIEMLSQKKYILGT